MSDAYHLREEAKALQKSDDGVRGITVDNHVYEALNFVDPSKAILPPFTTKHYKFLHAYRLGVPLVEAATKAGMTPERADAFLRRPSTIAWLQDRALKDHIKLEWEVPGMWYQKGQEFMDADDVPKHRLEVWKEFGDRVCPKTSRNADHETKTTIEINIDPASIERSIARRAAIDAEVIKQEGAA